jgi:hypothetical protein
MKRPILAFAAGLLLGVVVVSVLDCGLRIFVSSPRAPVLVGATLLAAFLPVHVRLFSLFPLWYHLVFLVTLIPLVILGARLARVRAVRGVPAGGART